jgi:hypothetical protein
MSTFRTTACAAAILAATLSLASCDRRSDTTTGSPGSTSGGTTAPSSSATPPSPAASPASR